MTACSEHQRSPIGRWLLWHCWSSLHLGSFFASYVFERQEAEADRLADASKTEEMLIERSTGLVYAITMESLAIYASATWDEAKPYAAEISLHLGELDAVAKRLSTASVENESAAIASASKHIDDFIAFRTVLARLARETGVAAARSVWRQRGQSPQSASPHR